MKPKAVSTMSRGSLEAEVRALRHIAKELIDLVGDEELFTDTPQGDQRLFLLVHTAKKLLGVSEESGE